MKADREPRTVCRDASRRSVLRGLLLAGATVPLLDACSDGSTSDGGSSGTSGGSGTTSAGGGGGGGGAAALASTADVPEGGGLIAADAKVVITQPSPGDFKGLSSICTHAGCPVDNVADGTINCVCHGSKFSIEDGSVVNGPATEPLADEKISVKGQQIFLA